MRPLRIVVGATALVIGGFLAVVGVLPRRPDPPAPGLSASGGDSNSSLDEGPAPTKPAPQTWDDPRSLSAPTGAPPALTCEEARRVVMQTRTMLATPAEPVDPQKLAANTSDWLDPHGLWSAAPDAPVAAQLNSVAGDLLVELEAAPTSGDCTAALATGEVLATWMTTLRARMTDGHAAGVLDHVADDAAWALVKDTPFEDGSVTRPGAELAWVLGTTLGAAEIAFPNPEISAAADVAIRRLVPEKSAKEWSNIVLAAAVRAYLPLVDPHGAWAPAGEETSIYDLDLEVDPPPRLWQDMTRTALGVRIDDGARWPLERGDVVISVGGVSLAGLSVEQDNQLAVLSNQMPVEVSVLRRGSGSRDLTRLEVPSGAQLLAAPPTPGTIESGLGVEQVPYGDGYVLVVRIQDVPDDLGDRLQVALFDRAGHVDPKGLLLDLRGNGGGSTDGAIGALGLFLPGAALFPMRRRDGEIEVDRAPRPPPELVYGGPLAVLVDGETASAAEMLAGGLAAYERGIVVGTRTYGKGCAQEYLDDDAGAGVLRLTTLVFSLPDGAPLQRVGVSPQIALGLPAALDREAELAHAPSTWRGPDVRDRTLIGSGPLAWPDHAGRVGAAHDPQVQRALRALGSSRAAAHTKR
ncbi:MAG: S41 family peptidase [Polyangiaceae bacterium]